MKFVKATERLPKQATSTEIVVRYKGYLHLCKAIAKKFVFREGTLPGNNILGEFEYENIEWLDMDEQDEGWVPVEQFADFLDTERNKGLDGRGKESLWNDMKIWGKTTAFKLMLEKFKDRQPPATT